MLKIQKVAVVEDLVTVAVKMLYWQLFSRIFAVVIKINTLDKIPIFTVHLMVINE